MVPSRSRNTAGRKLGGSGTLSLHYREPRFHGCFHHFRGDGSHTAMIRWAVTEKTRAAIRFLLNDCAARSHRSCAVRIRGAKHGDYRQTYPGSHVHRSRIVAYEKVTL